MHCIHVTSERRAEFLVTRWSCLNFSAQKGTICVVGKSVKDKYSTDSFPAQNGECLENVRDKSHSLDDREHGCPILPQPEGTECASQRRAIYRCDFPRIAAGKTIFLHLGPPRDLLIGGRTDKLVYRAWQALGIIILTPAQDATHRRGAATTRQFVGLGAKGVPTKITTGTKPSKRVHGLPAQEEPT